MIDPEDDSIDVPCPYSLPVDQGGYPGRNEIHYVKMPLGFNPEIEAMDCDQYCSLPFGIEIHEDGTVETYTQDDPRY